MTSNSLTPNNLNTDTVNLDTMNSGISNHSGRNLSALDQLLSRADKALRTLSPGSTRAERQPANSPNQSEPRQDSLSTQQKQHIAGLMRINHTGEVCAQALYQGQATTAGLPHVRHAMEQAAREEEDHLAWCEDRIRELNGIPSRLNPLFYAISFALGAAAGVAGDRWSLGFVAETEHQVVAHLDNHLAQIPQQDQRTRTILEQMREDELRHAITATDAGGSPLPAPIKGVMTLMSKVMTSTTYRF